MNNMHIKEETLEEETYDSKSTDSEELFLIDKIEIDETLKLEASFSDDSHVKEKEEQGSVCSYSKIVMCKSGNVPTHEQSCNIKTTKEESDKKTHGKRSIRCHICNSILSKSDLTKHMATHEGDGHFECCICNYTSTKKTELVEHTVTHTLEKSFRCLLCQYNSTKKHNLKRHMKCHKVQRSYECVHCGYKAKQTYELVNHLKIHSNRQMKKHSEKSYLSTVSKSEDMATRQSCNFETIKQESDKKIHGERLTQCHICNYSIFNKSDLATYERDENFDCCTCEYTSARTTEHTITLSVEKSFRCSLCEYSSKRKYGLQRHMKRHKHERSYECVHCGHKARRKNELINHLKIRSNKPIREYGNKKSGLLWYIENQDKEKPYKCTVCDYSATFSYRIKRHAMIHKREWPFRCLHCSYKSREKRRLIEHLKKHGFGEPFKCTLCEFTHVRRDSLNVHMKSHKL